MGTKQALYGLFGPYRADALQGDIELQLDSRVALDNSLAGGLERLGCRNNG